MTDNQTLTTQPAPEEAPTFLMLTFPDNRAVLLPAESGLLREIRDGRLAADNHELARGILKLADSLEYFGDYADRWRKGQVSGEAWMLWWGTHLTVVFENYDLFEHAEPEVLVGTELHGGQARLSAGQARAAAVLFRAYVQRICGDVPPEAA